MLEIRDEKNNPTNKRIGKLCDLSDHQSAYYIMTGLRIEALPLFPMFGPPWLYFCLLYVYCMQGRWSSYMPTLSETGTELVGHALESRLFAFIATMTAFSEAVVAWYVFARTRPSSLIRYVTRILYIISCGGMVGCGLFTMFDMHFWHFACAVSGFSLIIIYQLICWALAYDFMTPFQRIRRFLYAIIQVFCLIVIGLEEEVFDWRYCATLSTLAEYLCLEGLQAFLLSFYGEIAKCEIAAVIIE